jgi:UMF1 family MFS transporter
MTTVATAVFPPFFVALAAAAGIPEADAGSRFAFASSLSIVLVGLTGPLLGAVADFRGNKKLFLGGFVAVGVLATAAMAFISPGRWAFALGVFVLSNVAFFAGLAFYNALLPAVARPDEVDRVSTAGFAMGYLGGGVLLALNLAAIAAPGRFLLPSQAAATRAAFLSVAAWWALFSLPLFLRVKEPAPRLASGESGSESALGVAVRRLRETFRELRDHRDAGLMLLAFLVYNDAVNTIIKMGVIFGGLIGIPLSSMMATLVVVQLVGVPFAFFFGWLADRVGARRAIFAALVVYTGISVYAFALRTPAQFLIMGVLVGTVQGGAQALGRSLFASLVPRHKAGEMFGFFGVFDRFGGVMGTFVFGVVLATTGSPRPAILTLVVFFALGAVLLSRVDVERGRRLAREAEAAAHEAGTA